MTSLDILLAVIVVGIWNAYLWYRMGKEEEE